MIFSDESVRVQLEKNEEGISVCVCEFAIRNWLIQLWELAKQTGSPQAFREEYLKGRKSDSDPTAVENL